MRRREFITLLGGAVAWPLAARAQQPDRTRRIGVLMAFAESDHGAQSWVASFREELRKLGDERINDGFWSTNPFCSLSADCRRKLYTINLTLLLAGLAACIFSILQLSTQPNVSSGCAP